MQNIIPVALLATEFTQVEALEATDSGSECNPGQNPITPKINATMHIQSVPAAILLLLGASSTAIATCEGPAVNQATLDLVKEFEGWYPDIYDDPVGLPTVGYGHLCGDAKCSDIPYSIPLSKEDGQRLLQDDLVEFQQCITLATKSSVSLNDNQYGALVSWSFNVGCGAAQSSSLLQRLNDGENPNTVASEELPKWNKGGGEVLPGLERRRAAEVELHNTDSNTEALPVGC
ncbi:hypothetical protein VUR80DRAFT_5188 [Thermomyces stellatus]